MRTDDGEAICSYIDDFQKNPEQALVRERGEGGREGGREGEREGGREGRREGGREGGRERGGGRGRECVFVNENLSRTVHVRIMRMSCTVCMKCTCT